jgi:hypothetical protein
MVEDALMTAKKYAPLPGCIPFRQKFSKGSTVALTKRVYLLI